MKDGRGVGGFMEAILALMVVTMAIVLLSLSFSLAAFDAAQGVSSSGLDDLADETRARFQDDQALWRDDKLSWAALQYRAGQPYDVVDRMSGYEIEVVDISSDAKECLTIGQGTLQEGNSTATIRFACSIVTVDGEVHAGKVLVMVW